VRTLQGEPMVTAPGKLVLLGEYAVLDGFPAIVAAVNRRASGQFVPGRTPESNLVDIAVSHAKDALGPNRSALPRGSVLVDTAAFSLNGTKMGIGSSAATAAVTVGAVLEMAGIAVNVKESTDLIFNLALAAHREAQGGLGSGADVAAAVYGGVLHYTRPANGAATIRRLPPLAGVEMVVFSTGTASSTVDCLQAVGAFAKASPETHRQLLPPIADAVTRFEAGLFARDAAEIFAAIGAAHVGMEMLGQAAGVPIVTPVLAHAAVIAAEVGGAAKPSGAGGGDVGIAFLPDPEAAEEFRVRARGLGLGILDLFVDPTGISRL
jgi:phosphomevalonate kinase